MLQDAIIPRWSSLLCVFFEPEYNFYKSPFSPFSPHSLRTLFLLLLLLPNLDRPHTLTTTNINSLSDGLEDGVQRSTPAL